MNVEAPRDGLAAILAALPVALLAFDAQDRLILANPALHRRAGLAEGALGPGMPRPAVEGLLGAIAADLKGWPQTPLPAGGLLLLQPPGPAPAAMPPPDDPALLQAVMEHLATGFVAYGPDNRVRLHSPSFPDIAGVRPEQMRRGTHFHQVIDALVANGELTPAQEAEVRARAADMRWTERSVWQRSRPDGRTVRFQNRRLPDGGWLGEATDVTREIEAARAAERSEGLHKALVDALPMGIAIYDAAQRLTYVNPAYNSIFPESPARLGDNLRDILMRRALSGEFGPGDPEAEVAMRCQRVRRPFRFQRVWKGRSSEHSSVPLPDGGHAMVVADITALTAAQSRLAEREALLSTTIEAIGHGIAMYDAEGRVILANRLAAELCGVPPEAFASGTPIRELRRAQFARGFKGTLADRSMALEEWLDQPLRAPDRYVRRSPDGRMVEVRSDLLPGGRVVRSYTDITALARAEADAQARAATLQTVLDSMRHGVALHDTDGRVVLENAQARDLADPTLPPPGPVTEPVEKRITPDGRVIEVRTDATPEGGWVRSFTDVTALTDAQAEADRRSAMMEVMLENMRHGVVLFDAGQRVLAANRMASALLGVEGRLTPGTPREELVRRQVEAGEFGDALVTAYWRRDLGGRDWTQPQRYQRRRPNGQVVEIMTQPLPDGGFIASLSDVTERVEAAEELERRAAALAATLNAPRQAIALYDAQGCLIQANLLLARLAGFSDPAEMRGLHYGDVIRQQCRVEGVEGAEAEARVHAVLRWDRRQPLRYQRKRADGTRLEIVSDPVPGGGFIVTVTDVTELALAREEVQRRAEVLAVTLNASRHGITLFDSGGRVVAANGMAARIAGFADVEDMVGLPHAEVISSARAQQGGPPGLPPELAFDRMDRSRPQRYQRRTLDGRMLDVASDPVPGGGYVVTIADITELSVAREQAQQRAAVLAAALNASRHAMALYDASRRVVATNMFGAELAGFPDEASMLGLTFEEVLRRQAEVEAPNDPAAQAAFRARVGDLDRREVHRYQRRHRDGRILDVQSNPTPDGGFAISVADVTALVTAQEEAQRRAGVLQAMLENSRHGIVLYDRDHRLVAANALAGELMGVPDLLARPGTTHAEVLAAQRARGMYRDGQGGHATEEEFRTLDRSKPQRMQRSLPDGRRFDIASDPTPDGGFVISVADVTPLVRAEAEAERRAGVLQTIVDNISLGILLYDRDRRLVAVNELAAEAMDLPDLPRMIGLPMDDILALQLRNGNFGTGAEAARLHRFLVEQDRSLPQFHQRITADGRVLNNASHPTPDGGFVVSMADVTPLARAQAESARRAAMLANMLDNIRHGIALFDPRGRLSAINPRLPELLGVRPDALRPGITRRELVEILCALGEYDTGPEGTRVMAEILSHPASLPARWERRRPNGRILEVINDPTPDGGFLLTYMDVTEDRRIRLQLEDARAAAEAASLAKSRFLATMSHELRTPLNAVIGFSEVLSSDAPPAETREFARAIREAGQHLLTLIDDILDVTRAESGLLPVKLGLVPLPPLLEGVERIMRPVTDAARLEMAIEMAPALPVLRADEQRLRQVLLNLVTNAAKFTPAGGRITLAARRDGPDLLVEVRDTGIGIAAADLSRVFEPFTQLDSSLARRYPGAGLGLYLCRVLTEAQGGTLVLHSAEGQGTRALLRFPPASLTDCPAGSQAPES